MCILCEDFIAGQYLFCALKPSSGRTWNETRTWEPGVPTILPIDRLAGPEPRLVGLGNDLNATVRWPSHSSACCESGRKQAVPAPSRSQENVSFAVTSRPNPVRRIKREKLASDRPHRPFSGQNKDGTFSRVRILHVLCSQCLSIQWSTQAWCRWVLFIFICIIGTAVRMIWCVCCRWWTCAVSHPNSGNRTRTPSADQVPDSRRRVAATCNKWNSLLRSDNAEAPRRACSRTILIIFRDGVEDERWCLMQHSVKTGPDLFVSCKFNFTPL
jgi:hypothetical protein